MRDSSCDLATKFPHRRMPAALQRFVDDEEGSLILLTLLLFMLMVLMGGLAVDIMRYEQTRTTLQNTLDRATLASASLTQTLDAEDVVLDYFDKAGMSDYLDEVTVTQGLNYKNVTADASAITKPIFMNMFYDVNSKQNPHSGEKQGDISVNASSTAEQRVSNVEISLVLDVSGSMASNSKLTNLKSAAKEFVSTVMKSDSESRIAISLVPFNGQVNLGPDLRAKFTGLYNDPGVTNVNCVDMPSSVYSTTGIATNFAMPMTAHADTYSSTSTSNSYLVATNTSYAIGYNSTYNSGNVWCPPISNNIVRLPQRDITTLQGYISGLTAVGATSINAGFKWGLTLLDPSFATAYNQLRLAGKIPSELTSRPYSYTDKEAMKVIVLMTDGSHFAQQRIQEAYKSGNSTIYKSDYDGLYSVYHDNGKTSSTSNPRYYVPYNNTWQATPWTRSGYGVTSTYKATQQTWKQVWNDMRVSYVAWQFYGRALGGSSSSSRTSNYNSAMAKFVTEVDTDDMDDQLEAICTLAKKNGVIVYGIAFEAPTAGQQLISDCATSSSHYYNATGLQISTAFRSIASNISQLRLIQ